MKLNVRTLIVLATLCYVFDFSTLFGQAPSTAGSRLFYTQKGFLPRQGTVSMAFTGAGFRDQSGYSLDGGITQGSLAQTSGDFAIDYSLNKNYMLSLATNVFYTSPKLKVEAPDFEQMKTDYVRRISLSLRTGSFGVFNDRLQLGSLFKVSIPLDGNFNDPFQPVSLTVPSFGVDFITSYYFDRVFPRLSPGFHLNLGLNFLSTGGENLSNTDIIKNQNDILALRYALGFDYPFNNFVSFFTEIYGEAFAAGAAPSLLYGRDAYSYFLIGGKVQVIENLWLELAGEFLVTDNKSSTQYNETQGIVPFTTNNINYPFYRGIFGLRYEFNRRKYIPNKADVEYSQAGVDDIPFKTASSSSSSLSPLQIQEMEIRDMVAATSQVDSLTKLYKIEESALSNARREYQTLLQSPNSAQESARIKSLEEKINRSESDLSEAKNSLDKLKKRDAKTRVELRRLYAKEKLKPKKRQISQTDRQRGRIIIDVIDEQSEDIALLFKELRKYDEKLYGRLYYEITIGKNGKVERVRLLVSSLDDALPITRYTEDQISERVRNWKFPSGDSEIVIDILKLELTPSGTLRISS